MEEDPAATQASIKCAEPLRGDPALSSTYSPAMATARACASERRGRRRRGAVRFPSDGQHAFALAQPWANVDRSMEIQRPRAHAIARPRLGTVSGLGRVSWLEPESDSDPRNSENQLGFDFKTETLGI